MIKEAFEDFFSDKYAWLMWAVIIICAFYIYKPTFLDGDSYYFLLVSQGLWHSEEGVLTPLFESLPQPSHMIKAMLGLLMLVSMIFVMKAGEVLYGEKGWLCGLFLLLNPVFVFESLKFEDEQLIYPLLMLAFYLFVWIVKKKKYLVLIAPAFAILAGAWLWIPKDLGLPYWSEPEYIPLMVVVSMMAASVGLLGYYYEKSIRFLAPLAILSFFLCLALPKLAFFASPFLAVGFFPVFERLQKKIKIEEETVCKLALILAVLIGFSLQIQPITEQQQEIVKQGVAFSQDYNLPLKNEWSWGYLVAWNGGNPSHWAGGEHIYDFNHSIAVTRDKINCEMLAGKDGLNEIKVYRCD